MTCAGGTQTFRLLDVNVGWGADSTATVGLIGFDDPQGTQLAQTVAGAVDPSAILPYLPPARLARGCGPSDWYLVTPAPPQSLLLHRDFCEREWHPVWGGPNPPASLADGVAVATWRQKVAVSDRGANRVFIWWTGGTRALGQIAVTAPGPIAFSPRGELLVTAANNPRIARFGPDGGSRGYLKAPLPAHGTVLSLGVDATDRVWVVLRQEGAWLLLRAGPDADQFAAAPVENLQTSFPATGLLSASPEGFCLDEDATRGLGVTTCYSWYGRRLPDTEIVPPSPPQRQTQGQLITTALDSGIPRCEWHRVRIDADVPAGTTLSVSVATTEETNPKPLGDASRDKGWEAFPPGAPHFSDWTAAPNGSVDFLIDQPVGRYLYLRLRMIGNGTATPVVRRVRMDFPRVTSLDFLPSVYRETPRAENFTARFLSLFDASIADLDSVIELYPALLDPSGVPDQLLPWLGGLFDIGFDPAWDAARRRRILPVVPQPYRLRGTLAGLQLAAQTVFDVTPSIQELSSVGPWGSIAAASCRICNDSSGAHAMLGRPARLGAVRLFGKARARFMLGRSSLGGAPVRSYGNPDRDPFVAGAYRFQVLVPPMNDVSPAQRQRVTNLIAAQSPAHTVASVRFGGTGFLLGNWSAVGVDTAFVPLAPPILGTSGTIRLSRMSVLWRGRGGRPDGTAVGQNSIVGMQIITG
jgi:phage tail-like protein